jgi:hypothetical protein
MDKGRPARAAVAVVGVAVSWVGIAAPTATSVRANGPLLPGTTIEVPQAAPTIQAAVDRAAPGTLILVAPGIYRESVTVTRPDLVIRGVDRNRSILDGQFRRRDGIDVRADGVALENLTARNFIGNGFYWQYVDGYRGSYLTASRDRQYGLYAAGSQHGQFDHSYVSGSADSGFYVGACNPCHAVVSDVLAENNAVGFSGTNASGDLAVVASRWRHNRLGIVPNSLDDEPLAPQDGLVIAGNQVVGAPGAATPHSIEFDALDGTGIALVGVLDDVVTKNRVSGQARHGIVVAPNPGIESRFLPSLRNQVRANVVEHSGTTDLVLAGTTADQGNCFEQNQFRTSVPANLEQAVPCSGAGTGNLTADAVPIARLFTRRRHAAVPSQTPPAAPTQPNMPAALTAPPRPATAEPSISVDLTRIVVPPPSSR